LRTQQYKPFIIGAFPLTALVILFAMQLVFEASLIPLVDLPEERATKGAWSEVLLD
jgi:hypothetical protein